MKSLMIKRALIAAIIILSGIAGYPHKSDDVGKTVKEIVINTNTQQVLSA